MAAQKGLRSLNENEFSRIADLVHHTELHVHNLLTVERAGGRHLTYDPDRLHGVNVYRETGQSIPACKLRV